LWEYFPPILKNKINNYCLHITGGGLLALNH